LKTTTQNLMLWEQRIKERVQNGMTIGEWCKKNGVSKYQYNYWNRRVSKKQKTDEEITFADISSILSNNNANRQHSASASEFQIFFKSMQVTVPSEFNPTALAGLMKVLQEL